MLTGALTQMAFQIPHCPTCHKPLATPWFQMGKATCHCCGHGLELQPEPLTTLQAWATFFAGAALTGYGFTNLLNWVGFQDQSLPRVIADILIALAYYLAWRYVFFLSQDACLPNTESADPKY
jgi:hypothetical protein